MLIMKAKRFVMLSNPGFWQRWKTWRIDVNKKILIHAIFNHLWLTNPKSHYLKQGYWQRQIWVIIIRFSPHKTSSITVKWYDEFSLTLPLFKVIINISVVITDIFLQIEFIFISGEKIELFKNYTVLIIQCFNQWSF